MGRPTRFRPQFVRKIGDLLLLGLPNHKIAEFLGVAERTLDAWRLRFPAVSAVFASHRELAQAGIARSLYKRASGYSLRKKRVEKDETGKVVKEVVERHHYPPDVEAAKFILSRRLPDVWPADRGVQVGVQVVAGLPEDTLSGLQKLARATSGLALPEPNREEGNAS